MKNYEKAELRRTMTCITPAQFKKYFRRPHLSMSAVRRWVCGLPGRVSRPRPGAAYSGTSPAEQALAWTLAVNLAASITKRTWWPWEIRSTPSSASRAKVSLRPST